ncbi:MAG: hypothetical protein A2Y40_04340 [Candidatus Margulisbacteria bacterium GWF2_35_9]|nr:MAG: hypothetical protein A2Y40_04340 [Candidatus Margulisbacteria bacterium GWF2_35_9]
MIITRFAPSPTGHLHIGGARTALFSYLYAKHCKGKFFLRMEDTDQERSKPEFAESIIQDLKWLGIVWDNDVIPYQSQRLTIYQKYLDELKENNFAYEKEGAYFLKGHEALEDFIIFKSSGMPTFHFAVVIDDHEMGVNTIIRGVDHLTNTDKHRHLYKCLGLPIPEYYHIPLIVDENSKPLSKRRNDSNMDYYRENHFFPEAVFNYFARLGWGYQNQEIFSKEELIELFDVKKTSKNPARFDPRKLSWVNIQYLKIASPDKIKIYGYQNINMLIKLSEKENTKKLLLNELQQKAISLQELNDMCRPFIDNKELDTTLFNEYGEFISAIIPDVIELVKNIASWSIDEINTDVHKFMDEKSLGMKEMAMPLRVILTGQKKSLDLNSILFYLGKDEVIDRLNRAKEFV